MQRTSRNIKVAAAQLGPIQKADTRQAVVARMLELMRQAEGCDLIVYPELALTTFFPRWHYQDRSDADIWFEREMPSAATRPLFEEAKRAAMAMSFGYAELTPGGQHFNTSILVDKAGTIVGKYRKVHLPGHDEFDPKRSHQHLEKRYFEPGDLGFPAWRMLGRRVRHVHLQRPPLAGDVSRARPARRRDGFARLQYAVRQLAKQR